MAIPYVTGPGLIYVAFGAGSTFTNPSQPYFLGTCERTPEIDLNPEWEVVMNSVGGTRIPIDDTYQGEWAIISTLFTRWNEPTYARLANYIATSSGTGQTRGRTNANTGDLGTLLMTQARAIQLWVKFPYANLEPFASNGMPAGYRFFATKLVAPTKLSPIGTEASKRALVWHARRLFYPSLGDFISYDHNMEGLPPPD